MALVVSPEQQRDVHGRLGFGYGTIDSYAVLRLFSVAVLHLNVGTIPPSGPQAAIASFGSSEGHSLAVGPPGCRTGTRTNLDTHLRTVLSPAPSRGCPPSRAANRAVPHPSQSVSVDGWDYSGLYSFSSFHIRNTVAAMMRASESFARVGFVPESSMRSYRA